jgi:hypothetical protein
LLQVVKRGSKIYNISREWEKPLQALVSRVCRGFL